MRWSRSAIVRLAHLLLLLLLLLSIHVTMESRSMLNSSLPEDTLSLKHRCQILWLRRNLLLESMGRLRRHRLLSVGKCLKVRVVWRQIALIRLLWDLMANGRRLMLWMVAYGYCVVIIHFRADTWDFWMNIPSGRIDKRFWSSTHKVSLISCLKTILRLFYGIRDSLLGSEELSLYWFSHLRSTYPLVLGYFTETIFEVLQSCLREGKWIRVMMGWQIWIVTLSVSSLSILEAFVRHQ